MARAISIRLIRGRQPGTENECALDKERWAANNRENEAPGYSVVPGDLAPALHYHELADGPRYLMRRLVHPQDDLAPVPERKPEERYP
jgi:hypothetical protein